MGEARKQEVIESGFKLTVPEETSFRLCESPAYKNLSGLGLKEMDVGWWDNNNGKLILLELKGHEIWQEFDKSRENAHQHLVNVLDRKVTDALLMLAAVWVKTEIGDKLKTSLPEESTIIMAMAGSNLSSSSTRQPLAHPF